MDHSHDSSSHPTVTVRVGSWQEEIDVAIAPLIREMWIAGIETLMSCQGDEGGKIWIAFSDVKELLKFLNLVARYEEASGSLYNRLNCQIPLSSEDRDRDWEYDLFSDDTTLILAEPNGVDGQIVYDGPPDIYFSYSCRFPSSDMPVVLQRLQVHNQRTAARVHGASPYV